MYCKLVNERSKSKMSFFKDDFPEMAFHFVHVQWILEQQSTLRKRECCGKSMVLEFIENHLQFPI